MSFLEFDLSTTKKNLHRFNSYKQKGFVQKSRTTEVWISHHHHLVLISMRSQYIQGKPKIKLYRDYKRFNLESFSNGLNELLKAEQKY